MNNKLKCAWFSILASAGHEWLKTKTVQFSESFAETTLDIIVLIAVTS